MKRTRSLVSALSFVSFILLTASAVAQHTIFHFDPAQTEIRWKAHENLHVVKGTLVLNGGMLALNSKTGSAQGEILVDTDTLQSGNRSRDARLKKDILETGKYPQAFFHPTRINEVRKEGEGQRIILGGMFNLHGSDHPFTVSVYIERKGTQATVRTQFKIPYVAWGLKRPGGLLWRFSKEIEIDVNSHATVEEVAGA